MNSVEVNSVQFCQYHLALHLIQIVLGTIQRVDTVQSLSRTSALGKEGNKEQEKNE